MRAARLHELGATPRIDETEEPQGVGIVQVTTAALNPIDLSIANGRFYGGSPTPPYIVGSEAVGSVADGRRFWLRGRGLLAERVAAQEQWMFELPDDIDDATALGAGIAGLTAWLALTWRAPVRSDDTVLVLGASGSVGAIAVRAAKLLGARRVIGAARRTPLVPDEADEVVDLGDGSALPPATLIIDALWGDPIERALAVASPGARIVQLGQSAGPTATLPSGWVRGGALEILGHSLSFVPHEVAGPAFRELCGHVRDGRIAVRTTVFPFDGIAEAWQLQGTGSPGSKILLTVS